MDHWELVVLFRRRSLWATALCVLSSLVLIVPQAFSQTEEIPPWRRCAPASGTEAGEQCKGEGGLSGRALSDAYILIGASRIPSVEAELNSADSQDDRWALHLLLSAYFQQAIDADLTNVRARVCRGLMFLALPSADSAVAEFSKALRMEPKDYGVLIARAKAYTMKKQFRRALDDLNRAIELNPMKASAFGFRGDMFRLLGWPGRAYADYNNAAKREPDVTVWVERRDAAARLLGQRGKARRGAPAADAVPTNVTVNFVLGQDKQEARDTLKRWESGEVSLQEARQLFEGNTPRCVLHYL
jgi:tetratricopeptide (TPR) repeat protein